MKKLHFVLGLVIWAARVHGATTNFGPWTPLFKGVEYSFTRVVAATNREKNEAIHCLRIDLTDRDISLFTTPHCTNACSRDTATQNTSHFLETYGLQVAINCNFSSTSDTLGSASDVKGLAISQGNVVSPQDNDDSLAALLFTTSNVPTLVPSNWPPVSTEGIFTAVCGNVALLINGTNAAPDDDSDDPRTAFGVSQDNRYLYLMAVDGRQDGWSDGMTWIETADWLARFGAYNGVNVDGGGSTTMSMADCQGRSIRLNSPSYVVANGRERITGHNFGVFARRLPESIKDLDVTPGAPNTVVTWRTEFDATTQVEYGLTTNYDSVTPLDPNLVKIHVATLTGLLPETNYFFRVISSDGVAEHSFVCRTATTGSVLRTVLFGVTNRWKFTTNNLDGVNWNSPDYDDSSWTGSGGGLLHIDSSSGIAPKTTVLPPGLGVSPIMRTYYFRTRFPFDGSLTDGSLLFSNFVDDGAVFYLNGTELFRLRMPPSPAPITNLSFATGIPCQGMSGSGDATTNCFDLVTLVGPQLASLVQGDNLLAVEVHNYSSGSDLVFGSALFAGRPVTAAPRLNAFLADGLVTIYWGGGEGYVLQQSSDLSAANSWVDVPGPVTSPLVETNAGTRFFRLRQ